MKKEKSESYIPTRSYSNWLYFKLKSYPKIAFFFYNLLQNLGDLHSSQFQFQKKNKNKNYLPSINYKYSCL